MNPSRTHNAFQAIAPRLSIGVVKLIMHPPDVWPCVQTCCTKLVSHV